MKLGKPLDIEEILLKGCRNRVHLVGVELEGGWKRLPAGTNLTHDGSVGGLNGLTLVQAQQMLILAQKGASQWTPAEKVEYTRLVSLVNSLKIGELPSPPMAPEKVPIWLAAFYPSHINNTCGMHAHLSFKKTLTYDKLMDPRYPATVVDQFVRWAKKEKLPDDHPIWPRLKDENRYCRHAFYPDLQAAMKDKSHNMNGPGNRYTVINYCHQLRGTLECRLLPMFDGAQQAVRAINHLILVTNAFLLAVRGRETKVPIEATLDDPGVREESQQFI